MGLETMLDYKRWMVYMIVNTRTVWWQNLHVNMLFHKLVFISLKRGKYLMPKSNMGNRISMEGKANSKGGGGKSIPRGPHWSPSLKINHDKLCFLMLTIINVVCCISAFAGCRFYLNHALWEQLG